MIRKLSLVLATYHIRPLNQAFKSAIPSLSQLVDSPEEEYNRNVFICSSSKGVMYTVHGILLFIKHSTSLCLQSLHHHYIHRTKPDTATSLMVGTLTDLARSKSELVAENALLRQQLIILRRHIKRPACTKTDRMLLVLLARAVRTWQQALFVVQPETNLALASPGFSALLEVQIQSSCSQNYAPRAHAICERFLGSVRRECLDHLLILHEKQLQRVLNAYVCYFNRARPHQGIKQQIPEQKAGSVQEDHTRGKVIAFPILGGLYHDYRRSA